MSVRKWQQNMRGKDNLPFMKESAEFTSETLPEFNCLLIIPMGEPGVPCCKSTSGCGDDVGEETLPLAFGVRHAYKPDDEIIGFEMML